MLWKKIKTKGVIVLIVLLILCIIGLVFYILVDKDVIKLNSNTVENEQVENNNTSDEDNAKNDDGVAIDPENASIKELFDNAHYLTISGIDTHIYRDGGYKVSEMSTEDKMLLLAKQWSPLVEQYSEGTSPNLTTTYYINENTLKNDADGLDSNGANWYNINELNKKELSPFTIMALEKLGYSIK